MLRLNLGAGNDIREGYDNIDIRPLPNVIQADVCNLPYEKGTVDEIVASDIYEHVSYHKSKDLLKHWISLLKPGGKLILRAPCLDAIILYFIKAVSLRDIEIGIAAIFGGQDYKENTHYTIAQSQLMEQYLRDAGIHSKINFRYSGLNGVWEAVK